MKYYVDYMDKSGDLCHVWVEAENKKDAENQAKSENWDIDYIINIRL